MHNSESLRDTPRRPPTLRHQCGHSATENKNVLVDPLRVQDEARRGTFWAFTVKFRGAVHDAPQLHAIMSTA